MKLVKKSVCLQFYVTGSHLNLPGVGMRTRAHFVRSLIHVTVTFRQGVEHNEVKIDLFLAVAVLGCEAVGARV